MSAISFSSIRIVGSGLIGTSIGLALASKGVAVEMVDNHLKSAKLAQDLVNSVPSKNPEVVLFSMPSSSLAAAIESEYLLNPTSKFIDIGSVKAKPQADVTSSSLPPSRFLATHPMAGREVGGAEHARADLFQGRSWIYCPNYGDGSKTDSDVIAAGLWLIEVLGATAVSMSATDHDAAVALVSHLPQIVASLLAGQLQSAGSQELALAGAGLSDTTRIAASDPELWDEIISANRDEILPLLMALAGDLNSLILKVENGESTQSFIEAGNLGKSRIPGKHGRKAREYKKLSVVIEDKPGQLAALFDECALAEVNVEDLNIEHSPGQFTGLITLSLSAIDSQTLQEHLKRSGWSVHAPR